MFVMGSQCCTMWYYGIYRRRVVMQHRANMHGIRRLGLRLSDLALDGVG